MRLRVRRKFVWIGATAPLVTLSVFVSWIVLAPPEERARPARQVSRSEVNVARSIPEAARPAEDAAKEVRQTPAETGEAEEALALDRLAEPRARGEALRRLALVAPRRASKVALALLRGREPSSLEREALRVVASGADRTAAPLVLEALARASDTETALACGAALDAWAPLEATDLSRVLSTASLEEARVVLLRALALATPRDVSQVAIEETLRRDSSPLVRSEAFAALDAARLSVVSDVVVADLALRQAAPRVLARTPGREAERVLEDCFRAESDPEALRLLAQVLARRSEEARLALRELARATPERSAIADDVFAALDQSKQGKNR
jgi:hypothetical protein